MAYMSKCKANLPIYGIKNKDLKEFQTTERDVKKGISRIPMQIARLVDEDIMQETNPTGDMSSASLMVEPLEMDDSYAKVITHIHESYNRHRGDSI
jgi:hypothetical protein